MMQTGAPVKALKFAPGAADPTSFVKAICNYPGQKTKLYDFFSNFEEIRDDPNAHATTTGRGKRGSKMGKNTKVSVKKYMEKIGALGRTARTLDVDMDDILKHYGFDSGVYTFNDASAPEKSADVLNTLLTNTNRALRLLYDTVEEVRKEHFPAPEASTHEAQDKMNRKIALALNLPTMFRSDYEIRLIPPSRMDSLPIHSLRACNVGGLNKIEGVVSKITTVKPRLAVAVYKCEDCGALEFQHIETPSFTPLGDCTSTCCKTARRKGTLTLSLRDSKFVKRQEGKIQELPHKVPPGTVPRQLKIVLNGELTRVLKPGMSVTVGGVFLPVVDSAWRNPRGRDSNDTILEAHHVQPHRSVFDAATNAEGAGVADIDQLIKNHENLYEKLAASIAPAIHGHEDVKKALLLQLVGGVTDNYGDGLKIRGDIHMLLMGDPGIAKSQLLLRVCTVAPRAHFTCGKGASGVGLTASVVKDPVTGEFTLEGGAIVLADNGICCVDEFDKMQESDRTAIHEVMEQQTVSISKAGLTATLNARTTILAAANPVFGRYDIHKSAVANIGLPAALLSRFDIVFLLLDEGGHFSKDLNMARYLLRMHKDKKVSTVVDEEGDAFQPFTAAQIRAMIARTQLFKPRLTQSLADSVSEHYVDLRLQERSQKGSIDENTYTTPRTLMALLRLSQAHARLRFSDVIEKEDFEEALRLMQASKASVLRTQLNQSGDGHGMEGERIKIMKLIRQMTAEAADRLRGKRKRGRQQQEPWVSLEEATRRAADMEVSADVLEETVESLVVAGTVSWDGPQKLKFLMMDSVNLDTIEENEEDSSE